MNYKNIVCIDDFVRQDFEKAKVFFYNLIREPILQATAIDIGESPRLSNSRNSLKDGFCLTKFTSLLESSQWQTNYHSISERAQDYLIAHLPEDVLIISYEMPKWLEAVLDNHKVDYIDIRISPLRFARDLYIVLRSNHPKIQKRINKFAVKEAEFRLEASLAIAYARNKAAPAIADDSVVFIGQTESDASLINENGEFCRVRDYELKDIQHDRQLYYLAHPLAGNHAKNEFAWLSRRNKAIEQIDHNVYNLLSMRRNVEFIAISSSVIQEAKYFDKKGTFLYQPVCPIDEAEYIHIHFSTFVSPIFWHKALKIKSKKPEVEVLPSLQLDWLRSLHNVWWGYAPFKKQNSFIDKEAFDVSGGAELRREFEVLKASVEDNN